MGTLNFAAYEDWIPPETMEILIRAIVDKHPDYNPRAFILQAHASREKDKAKRITLLREVVDKYPDSHDADSARKRLLLDITDISQREELYQQLRTKDPADPFQPFDMASLYVQMNQKLPEALALLDEADKLFDASVQNKQATIHYPESTLKDMKLRIAIMRSDIDPIGQAWRCSLGLAATQDRVHLWLSLLSSRQSVGTDGRQARCDRCLFRVRRASLLGPTAGECSTRSPLVERKTGQRPGLAAADRSQARSEL
jgi:tetratricopeptide (TPR) repeat protein